MKLLSVSPLFAPLAVSFALLGGSALLSCSDSGSNGQGDAAETEVTGDADGGGDAVADGVSDTAGDTTVDGAGDSVADVPGDTVVDVPEDSTLDVPEDSTLDVPEDSTLDVPEDSTLDVPEDSTLDVPEDSTLDVPEDSTLDVPDGLGECIPCGASDPCSEGACVSTSEGQCCAPTCTTTCPEGTSCEPLPTDAEVSVCVPHHITLCHPCAETAGCLAEGFQPGAVCQNISAEQGSFCVTPCSDDVACPTGYACDTLEGAPDGGTFCVPTAGTCECDTVARELELSTPCSIANDAGECVGTRACSASGLSLCSAMMPAAESCDGEDNDCDGGTDEDQPVTPTTCGVGACAATGQESCVGGLIVDSCAAGTPAADDATCDGVDDDCDGDTDEDYVGGATTCGVGACAATGTASCVGGVEADDCEAGTAAADDATCDGVDDDCDGADDEDYLATETACGEGACAATGLLSCVDGATADSCEAGVPAADDATCDGVDDDCSGETDEDYLAVETECGVGACAATGTSSCVDGAESDSCEAGAPGADDATCDGVDDDCDGTDDEEFVETATACGTGACAAAGMLACVDGATSDSCVAGAPAVDDASCDGVDDDCSGETDEDYVATATACGVGACAAAGLLTCTGGETQDTCAAGSPAVTDTSCDGVDDDCNGETDEDYVVAPTDCGVGACASTGVATCVDGVVQDNCAAGTPAANDVSCDGVDDDCNGGTDDGYVATATSCGVGACASTGLLSCVGGATQDSCAAGAPAADDASCDGVDNDCADGTDEDYVAAPTSCGVGACASTGVSSCVGGVEGDSCDPGIAAADDVTCDGVDDDCDGGTDEGYVPTATACGVGACASTGTLTCVGGSTQDSCAPGTPAANDALCDGIDNDCADGTDEDYVPEVTGCGVGACEAFGLSSCVDGFEQDDCSAGDPAPDDATCDGIDDNCNGNEDEHYAPSPTTCGLGLCVNDGVKSCVDGAEVDSCVALDPPEATEVSCDNLDNDCDGFTDGADPDVNVETCCAGNPGQAGVDPARACPTNYFCDQSWDQGGSKSNRYQRACYYHGGGVGTNDGECSPYDCGKSDGSVQVSGKTVTYDWCELFKSAAVLGIAANHINAACGWATNGIFTSNSPRSGNGVVGNGSEFDGGYCSCNPLCEIWPDSAHGCCKNVFATGAFSGTATNSGFNCGKPHINTSTTPTFTDPHQLGSRCRHDTECLGNRTCTTPGTYDENGVPVPTAAPAPDGTCIGAY
jgi:hypothetical protein